MSESPMGKRGHQLTWYLRISCFSTAASSCQDRGTGRWPGEAERSWEKAREDGKDARARMRRQQEGQQHQGPPGRQLAEAGRSGPGRGAQVLTDGMAPFPGLGLALLLLAFACLPQPVLC